MEPIQLQCGSCGQVMGISPEHLGSQVQCPHCHAVVQTPPPADPPPAAAAAPPPEPAYAPAGAFQAGEPESIFSQAEPTDDLFGAAAAPPRVEMPAEAAPYAGAYAPTVSMEPAPPPPMSAPAAFAEAAATPDDQLTAMSTMRRVDKKGSILPVVLVFLVPYAIFTTFFIGYLLFTWPRGGNKLDLLPDTSPKGQPRLQGYQIKHDYELDRSQLTRLGEPIRVGDIEVTPLKIQHTPENDLVLVFKAKNISQKLIFAPTSDDFMRYSRKVLTSAKPYTFLAQANANSIPRIYGGNVEMFKGPAGRQPIDGDIGPGEEAVIHLTSEGQDREKVSRFTKSSDRLVWRVQVRRGLVDVNGRSASATTVIGVEFTARDIVKG